LNIHCDVRAQTILFKNINVSFTDQGKGRAVVFLHGFLGSKLIWKDFVGELSKTQRIITVDLLGHGSTDCLSYVHTMEEMAEAVEEVLSHLKLRKYFLVGHSLGGYVSLALAENNPDNIKGLILFNSTAKADTLEKKKDRLRAINVVKRNARIFVNEAIPKLFYTGKKPYKREIERAKKIALTTSKQGVVAALEGMRVRLDREIVLKFAPYSVLFIIGKEDIVLPYKELEQQAKLSEKSSYFLLENVGHMGMYEAKKETLSVIKQFVVNN